VKKIKQLVAQIDALTSRKSLLQAEHSAIEWGPNMDRAISARGRQIYNEVRALNRAIDLLRADIVNAALDAYSSKAD